MLPYFLALMGSTWRLPSNWEHAMAYSVEKFWGFGGLPLTFMLIR